MNAYIKIGIDMSNGKSNIKLPKNWNKLTESKYNGEANYAVLTGKVNDIIVIDIDRKSDDFEGLKWFEEHFGKIDQQHTLVTKTINNGYHVYFKYNTKIKTKLNFKNLHIDILVNDRCAYEGLNYDIICNHPVRELTDDEIDLFIVHIIDNTIPKFDTIEKIDINVENITEILDSINISQTYDEWMHVGFSLIDLCKQCNVDGKPLFHHYSKRNVQKYNKAHTDEQWNDWINRVYDGRKITRGTILKMFKDSNPKRFKEMGLNTIIDDEILKELDEISYNSSVKIHEIRHFEVLKKTKASIEALIESNGLEPIHNYVSKSCKHPSLFSECDRNGYKICCRNCNFEYPPDLIPVDKSLAPTVFNLLVINKDDNINNKDTSQVAKKIITYKTLIFTLDKEWFLYNETSGIFEKKNELEIMAEMENVVEQMSKEGFTEEWYDWINKVNYKENLIKELKIKCFKRVELDDNDFLLGFENGVLDLSNGIFRKGKIDEYVTMKCGVPFEENIDTTLALEVLEGIFPDVEEREYAMNKFALCLEGYNREQMITFNYSHTASNGKSFIMERLRQALGDYSGTFPVTLLTGKMKGAGETNSSLIDFNKKRFMYCSEPEAGAKLNTNYVKLLTGDRIKARGLYSERDMEISPTYKIYVCCNTLPNFDVYDEGIARRIRLLEYKTRFCEIPKKKNDRQLKKYSREEEMEISKGLLKLLVDKYAMMLQNNYKYDEPKHFVSLRKLYLNDNKDVITDLLNENFEKGEESDFVRLKDVKAVLKNSQVKEKDVITIIKLVEEMFDGVEFINDTFRNGERHRRVFWGLKTTI
jgi:phage/plasmid-associated DNA primase